VKVALDAFNVIIFVISLVPAQHGRQLPSQKSKNSNPSKQISENMSQSSRVYEK